MPEAALALEDLGAILLWAGAFALASFAYYVAKAFGDIIDIDIPLIGHPFHGVAAAFESAVVSPLNKIRTSSEANMAKGFKGLVDSLILLLGVTMLLGVALYDALKYLWNTALGQFVHLVTDPIVRRLNATVIAVVALTKTVALNLTKAEHYADTAIGLATKTIETTLRHEISVAEKAAESYADDAVSTLRKAETAALTAAVGALTAGIDAAERLAAKEVATAETLAAQALATADGIIDTSIAGVKRIAVTAEQDAATIAGNFGFAGAAGLIAAVPLLATLVHTIATETGLDNSECRGKVKQVCGTNPSAWTGLLEGLVAVGFAFSLAEMANVARPLIGTLEDVVKQAA